MPQPSSTYVYKNTLYLKFVCVSELKTITATEKNFRNFAGE